MLPKCQHTHHTRMTQATKINDQTLKNRKSFQIIARNVSLAFYMMHSPAVGPSRTRVCMCACCDVFYSLSRVNCTFCSLAGFVGPWCFQSNNSVSWCVCVCVIQGECLSLENIRVAFPSTPTPLRPPGGVCGTI